MRCWLFRSINKVLGRRLEKQQRFLYMQLPVQVLEHITYSTPGAKPSPLKPALCVRERAHVRVQVRVCGFDLSLPRLDHHRSLPRLDHRHSLPRLDHCPSIAYNPYPSALTMALVAASFSTSSGPSMRIATPRVWVRGEGEGEGAE
jgi:hypothetical protein